MDEAAVESPEPQNENEKASKNKARVRSGRKSALDFRKYTKQIWLAGLGAFSRAEEEGNKLFDSLVKVGKNWNPKPPKLPIRP